jgi:hypothetical protein
MSSSDDDHGSMQELQNIGVAPNYKRTAALRRELAHAPKHYFALGNHTQTLEAIGLA